MNTSLALLPVHSAIIESGGVSHIEVIGHQITFLKNGILWDVYAVGGAGHPFVLHKEGHRILGFTNPESLTNFFKGILNTDEHEKETETPKTEKG